MHWLISEKGPAFPHCPPTLLGPPCLPRELYQAGFLKPGPAKAANRDLLWAWPPRKEPWRPPSQRTGRL